MVAAHKQSFCNISVSGPYPRSVAVLFVSFDWCWFVFVFCFCLFVSTVLCFTSGKNRPETHALLYIVLAFERVVSSIFH